MVLLRRVIGDALRARRQGQHRTLREVSTAANVSLGYLSEIERGQKEASSELLAAICEALGAQLSELLRQVSDTLVLAEQVDGVLDPAPRVPAPAGAPSRAAEDGEPRAADVPAARPSPERSTGRTVERVPEREPASAAAAPGDGPTAKLSPHAHSALRAARQGTVLRRLGGAEGEVSVSIRRGTPVKVAPLKATLGTTRSIRTSGIDRDMVPVG